MGVHGELDLQPTIDVLPDTGGLPVTESVGASTQALETDVMQQLLVEVQQTNTYMMWAFGALCVLIGIALVAMYWKGHNSS